MRFSVILPVYNKAEYVKTAIESVMSQSYADWELIIVNDGSIDSSLAVVDSLVNRDANHRISVISQENAGVSSARNNGVQLSKGDYICFLDADDWWTPLFLEEMNGLIRACPEAGIYGTSYYLVKNHNDRIAPIALDDDFQCGYIDFFQVYSRYLCQPLWTGAVCIPRDVFMAEEGFKPFLTLGEDFELWARIAMKYKVAFLNKPLAYYFQDAVQTGRATKRLHDPRNHFLWHVSFLESQKESAECKLLLDMMRVEGLLDYYLSSRYSLSAVEELNKVDWSRQPDKVVRLYATPKYLLRFRRIILDIGSKIKRYFATCR